MYIGSNNKMCEFDSFPLQILDVWQHTWFDGIVLEVSVSISKIEAGGGITDHNFLHMAGDSSQLLHLALQFLHARLVCQALHYVAPVFGFTAKPQHPVTTYHKHQGICCKKISKKAFRKTFYGRHVTKEQKRETALNVWSYPRKKLLKYHQSVWLDLDVVAR